MVQCISWTLAVWDGELTKKPHDENKKYFEAIDGMMTELRSPPQNKSRFLAQGPQGLDRERFGQCGGPYGQASH
jgi:hypothetical protein